MYESNYALKTETVLSLEEDISPLRVCGNMVKLRTICSMSHAFISAFGHLDRLTLPSSVSLLNGVIACFPVVV
jgi:hypothetical protein